MRYVILLAPFVAALLALRMRDRLAAMLVVFMYLSVEGLLKLLSGYHPIIHIGVDILLWIVVAIWMAVALLLRQSRLPRVPFLLPLGFFVVWVVLLVLSPYTPSLFVGVASWKVHLSMIPLYFIGYLAAADPDAPRRFMFALVVFWCGAFAVTVLQFMGGPGGIFDLGEVYMTRLAHYHEWRPFGMTAVPGGQAIYALFALPFALCLVLRGNYSFRNPWILGALVGGLVVFYVSGIRQFFLASLIAVMAMLALQLLRGRGRAAGALVAFVIFGVSSYVIVQEYVVPGAQRALEEATGIPDIWRERNTLERINTLLDAGTYTEARSGGLEMIWDRVTNFPFGAGLGRTGSAASALGSQLVGDPLDRMIQERYGFQDNFFAAMLVETGIPGTVLLTTILIGLGFLAYRVARRSPIPQDSAFGAMVAGFMLAVLVMSWGSQPLLSNPTTAFFWFLGGMVARRYHEMRAQEASAPRRGGPERPLNIT